MGSKRETPGACNWQLTGGTYCTADPAPGQLRCKRHQHGPSASPGILSRFKGLTREGKQALDDYLTAPDLLDNKRAVALHLLVLEDVPFQPTDDQVEILAQAVADRRARAGKKSEAAVAGVITEADRAMVRVRLREGASKLLLEHQRLVESAGRIEDARSVMRAEALPVILDMGRALADLARRYVPQERQQEFVTELRATIEQSVARLGRAEHRLVRAARQTVARIEGQERQAVVDGGD